LGKRLFPEGKGSLLRYLALIGVLFLAALSLFPLYWGLLTSFKDPSDVVTIPPSFAPTRLTLENYRAWLERLGLANAPLGRWFANSAFVTITTTIGTVFTSSLAGYAFARKRFRGRDAMFWIVVATMLVPGWSTIIASYTWTLQLGLHDTYWVLILPGLAEPFAMFLFRQFAITLPDELFQAAKIDGASQFGQWWRIAIPLCRPVIATLAVLQLVRNWNAFLWPLLVINRIELLTIPVGVSLVTSDIRGSGTNYGRAMAVAMLMSVVPILAFVLVQRQMVQGIRLGALKG